MLSRAAVLAAILVVTGGCSGDIDRSGPPKVVHWEVTQGSTSVLPDGRTRLEVMLTARVDSGWKVYSLTQKDEGPMAMTVEALPDAVLVGDVTGPTPDVAVDPFFETETETYAGAPVFRVAIAVPGETAGRRPVELRVTSQACGERICLPPRTEIVTVPRAAGRS